MKSSRVRHIVIFLLKPVVDVNEVLSLLRSLQKSEDVIELTAEQSLDTRKGIVVIENALFKDEAAFERFKKSEHHKEVGERMSQLADWLVADYIEPA
jgi:quinol monooxygenase YgiN